MTLQRMREYELVMVLSPEATESEAAETVKRISESITDGGGTISQQDNWGVRRLAYPIQRFIEGNYFITRCSMDAQFAVELDTNLNSAQDVLRHLVFRLEKSEIAAIEAQAERERVARLEAERRAAAEQAARERDEARRLAMEQAEANRAAAEADEAEPATAVTAEAAVDQEPATSETADTDTDSEASEENGTEASATVESESDDEDSEEKETVPSPAASVE